MHVRPALLIVLAAMAVGGTLVGYVRERRAPPPHSNPDDVLQSIEPVLRREGLGAALDSLEQRAARDSALLREGHQLAHTLGRLAVTDRRGDAAVIRECRPVFASGCYHGVVEASLLATGRIDMAEFEQLCLAIRDSAGPAPAFECVHGLGHGVLGARGYDLAATLRDCDALSAPRLAASCHSGAFMEAINSAIGAPATRGAHAHGGQKDAGARPLTIDQADPYSPCRAYGDPYASSCWLFQGFLILRARDFDAARALAVCDRAPDGRSARCYESVGHQLNGLFQRGNRWILDQCARGQAALAPHCAAGAALALDAMDWSGSRATSLCTAAPAEWKEACYRSAAGALVDLAAPDQRARLCASVERAYAETCRQAGELSRTPRSPGDLPRPPGS